LRAALPSGKVNIIAMGRSQMPTQESTLLKALRGSMPRNEFFAGLCILACASGLGSLIIQSVNQLGWAGALLSSFEISAIMLILKTAPNRWRRHMISEHAAATDQVFIVFRGMVYTEQPTWQTLVTRFWSSFLRKFGLQRYTTPVIAVIATASCNVEGLAWYDLRERGVL
jgi:hypothetical protein